MKATNLWMRTTPFLLALLLGLLNWTAEPVSAQAESDGRLQPYWMAATTPPDGQTLLRTLDTPNPQEGAGFGRSMAMGNVNGDGKADVAVGVPSEDVGGNADQGRAYVFSGTSGSLLFTLNTPNPQAYASFGFSLAVGDVNDDGKADIAVGAPGEDVGDNNSQGRVYVFSSADGSLLFTLDTPNPQAGVTFGRSLAMGDVNGDGKGDIVVGAPFAQVGDNYNQGRAYIFSGTDGSLLLTLDTPNPQAWAEFGWSLAVGNVNGDEKGDIAVGVPYEDVWNTNHGRAYVFSGAGGSLLYTLNTPNPTYWALFGFSLAIGDVNGDGQGDVAVGADAEEVGDNRRQGRAYVFSGASGSRLFTLNAPNPQAYAYFGFSLAVGEMSGDGKGDIAVGALLEDAAGNNPQGQVYVFSGADRALLFTLDPANPQEYPAFGWSQAVGDVNGDGKGDVAVGAPEEDAGGNEYQGRAYVFSEVGVGQIDYHSVARLPSGGWPKRVATDKIVFAGDIAGGLGIRISGAQLHDRWTWRYYDPDGVLYSDSCYMEIRGPGEPGNPSSSSIALVTNCPTNPNDEWEALEFFQTGCPCTSWYVWTLGLRIAGHPPESKVGTWTAVVDYTSPGGQPIPAVAQDDVHLRHTPAVILIPGWQEDCSDEDPGDGMDTLDQNIEQELAVSEDRVQCFEYYSANGVEPGATHLAPFIRSIRQSLNLGPDEGVDLVGHSMGGLVARYYAQGQAPWCSADVHSVSMLGTPNNGAHAAKWHKLVCAISIPTPFGRIEWCPYEEDSQAIADMAPRSTVLQQLNNGFVLPEPPELPLYHAHAGGHESFPGFLASGSWDNDCAVSVDSVAGPGGVFGGDLLDFYEPLSHGADILGCTPPTLTNDSSVLPNLAATIKGTPAGATLATEPLMQEEQAEAGGRLSTLAVIADYVEASQSKTHQISVPDGLGDTAFVVYWLDTAEHPNLSVTLRRPNGQIVDPADPDVLGDVSITDEGFFGMLMRGLMMSAPEAGDWEITVEGLSVPEKGEPYLIALMPDSQVALDAAVEEPALVEGQPQLITATMFDGSTAIEATSISAQVSTPLGDELPITLRDDGSDGDEVAGDLTYSGTFTSTSDCGRYAVVVTATGTTSEGTVTREEFSFFQSQVQGNQVGDPCNADDDGDQLTDHDELSVIGTDPFNVDSDGDSMPDGYEHTHTCLNPVVDDAAADPDHDGQNNLAEYGAGTDPCAAGGAVGGIAEPPDIGLSSLASARGSSAPNVTLLLGAGMGAILLLAGGGWYSARHRRADSGKCSSRGNPPGNP